MSARGRRRQVEDLFVLRRAILAGLRLAMADGLVWRDGSAHPTAYDAATMAASCVLGALRWRGWTLTRSRGGRPVDFTERGTTEAFGPRRLGVVESAPCEGGGS